MNSFSFVRLAVQPRLQAILKTVPLRTAFVVPFLLQISLAVGITGWFSIRNGQQAVNDVAHQLRDEVSQRINQKLAEFLADPLLVNQLNEKAERLGYIDLQDSEQLYRHFFEQSEDFETVESIFYGGADGEFIGKTHLESAERSQDLQMVAGAKTQGSIQFYGLDAKGKPVDLVREVPDFDPRDRPWYKTAVAAGKPVWGEVFTYHAFPVLAVPAMVPIYDSEGDVQGVLGNNFFLDQVSEFLASLKVGQTGQTFIVERSGLILASSTLAQPFRLIEGVPERFTMVDSGDPLMEASGQFLLDHYGSLEQIRQPAQLEFWLDRDRQFVQIAPFQDEKGLDWLIVVVVPESDFMGAIQANTRDTIFLCLGALGVAIALGLVTARWVTRPLLQLSQASRAIAAGDLNQRVEVEGSQEISRLAETFNHMAQQLQTLFIDVQRSETRFQNLAENTPGVIYRYVVSPDGSDVMPYISLGCREVLGIEPQDVQANVDVLWQMIHPEDKSALRDSLAESYRTLNSWLWEWRIVTGSGQIRWLQAAAKPQRLDTGEVVWDGLILNVTDRKRAEESLKESEQRFRYAIAEAPFPIVIHAEDGEVLRVNHTWTERSGYQHADIPTMQEWMLKAYGEEHKEIKARIDRLYGLSSRVQEGEFSIKTRSGETRIWDFSSVPLGTMADGRRLVMSCAVDITQRKKIEQDVWRSRQQIADILESITDAFFALNHDWQFTYVNHRAEQILQRSRQDLLGKTIWQEFPAAIDIPLHAEFHRVMQDQVSTVFETFYPPLDAWYEVHAYASPDGMTAYFQDITARKETEALLQQTNRELERRVAERTAQIQQVNSRLSLALRAAHAGTWEWDMQTNEFFWSDENYRLIGYEPRSCDSTYANWLNAIHPDDVERVEAQVSHVVEQEEALNLEYRVLLPDGKVRWLGDLGEIVYDADGQPKGMAGIQVDITSRKQAEEQLRLSSERLSLANAELARAARLKDEFLAGMSHELRTPLNSVLGLSEALLEPVFGDLNDQQTQFIGMIQQSGQHLLDLINDILDLSKVQSGKMELLMNWVSVDELCEISLCFVKQQANHKQIALECQIDPNIGEIWGDELRMRQVLINLLSNAVKFTPEEGTVTLTVAIDLHHDAVALHVTDTGIGIAAENIGQLFQPFIQLDSGLARRYEGTGLGLSLVKKIVELHGGSVGLDSVVGQGSRFTVLLPRRQQTTLDVEEKGGEEKSGGQKGGEQHRLSDMAMRSSELSESPSEHLFDEDSDVDPESRLIRVLLAEDHEGNIMVLSSYLRHQQMEVTVARSGLEVLDYVKQQSFDVIVMDIQMSEMDGLTTMYKLQNEQAMQTVPIIVVTALAMPGDRERCMAAGAQDYLTKPVRLKHLRSLIRKYTRDSSL
ncbi:MAG: PAS domain S-box protein [Elainellaceae cyanobacterium]